MADAADGTSDDAVLGGRLMLRQLRRGHRAGHDAILLAASTDARAGHMVVDLGAGVGTAGLALARRVGGIDLMLIEINPELAALAAFNADKNGIAARVVVADVSMPEPIGHGGLVDRVLMNPPFHSQTRHRPSPDVARRIAHSSSDNTLAIWIGAAHRLLKSRGVLTLIWRADDLPQLLDTLAGRFGSLEMQPVYGARDKPAVRVLMRAVKGGRAPFVLHEPAVLDGTDPDVEATMRGAGTLALARDRRR